MKVLIGVLIVLFLALDVAVLVIAT